jgi:hypothetical protein
MKSKTRFIAISVLIGFVIFISISLYTELFNSTDLPIQISGALLDAVITALITYFLLTGQTKQEELRERQVKVFEKKQEIYYLFLEKLKDIIQDGEITIGSKREDGTIDRSVDELKDLLFILGYLRMHTSIEKNTFNNLLNTVLKILRYINQFNSQKTTDKNMLVFYDNLSNALFELIDVLKEDLYEDKCERIEQDKIKQIFKECGLADN